MATNKPNCSPVYAGRTRPAYALIKKCMEFNHLELLFLRRLVGENLDKKLGRVQYCHRQLQRGNKGPEIYQKLAVLESECDAMASLKNKLNDEIAMRELIK